MSALRLSRISNRRRHRDERRGTSHCSPSIPPRTRDPRPDNPLLIEEGEAGMDLTSGHPRRAVTVERGTSEENS